MRKWAYTAFILGIFPLCGLLVPSCGGNNNPSTPSNNPTATITFTPTLTTTSTPTGTPSLPTQSVTLTSSLTNPAAIRYAGGGDFWVTDYLNSKLQKMASNGTAVTTITTFNGAATFNGPGGGGGRPLHEQCLCRRHLQ